MDPITAMILAMAVAGITARFIGEGVGEAAAAVKGKPSPAAQKREAREKARRARGERPSESKPGLLRVMWDNAIEERTQKAAAKHVGRMEALREMSGHEQDKARQKLLRKAQQRAAVAERVAGLGNQSWGHARRVAEDTAALVNERRAERSARRGETPDAVVEVPELDLPVVEDDGADEGVVHESVDAEVIPLRRKKPSAAEQLQQELADHQAEQERVAAEAGTNAAPTLTMYSDWRRAQGREARTEKELRERFGPATEDDLRATQTRGSFRVIPQWRDANSTWQMWHREQITTQQLHQLLLEDSGIDPRLATELGMTAADLSPYAAQANACLETDEVYTPPTEPELRKKLGRRAPETAGDGPELAEKTRIDADEVRRRMASGQMSRAEVFETAQIDPELARELRIPIQDVQRLAASALNKRELELTYTPPTEDVLRRFYGPTEERTVRRVETMRAAPVEREAVEVSSDRILPPRQAAILATQQRGQYRVVEGWGDANGIWKRWHNGQITATERDAELAEKARIDPDLANELGMSAADLSPHAGRGLYAHRRGMDYEPPTEAELRRVFGSTDEDEDEGPAVAVARDKPSWEPADPMALSPQGQFRDMFGDEVADIWKSWKQGQIGERERDVRLAGVAGVDLDSGDPRHRNPLELSWMAAQNRDHNADWTRALELLRQEQSRPAEENGPGDPESETENTVDGGNPDMTSATAQTTTVPEIVDLATGINYTTTIGQHFTGLGAKLAEDAEVVGNNAAAFDQQVGVIEAGQAALAAQGFGGAIQSSFDEVAEKLPSAASKLRQVEQLLAEIGEEITGAATAMQSAKAALEDQRGLAEQVQAQSTSNGVARDTSFYQEA